MIAKEIKLELELEPDDFSLISARDYCEVVECFIEIEYDGDELSERDNTLAVILNEQDVTGELTRADYNHIMSKIRQKVTKNSLELVNDLELENGRFLDYYKDEMGE